MERRYESLSSRPRIAAAINSCSRRGIAHALQQHWCTCVMRSKVEPVKEVAAMVRKHLDGIVAWAQTRQTNGFLEAFNGLYQAAKWRARGFTRMSTIRTVIFLLASKLDFCDESACLFNPLGIQQEPHQKRLKAAGQATVMIYQ